LHIPFKNESRLNGRILLISLTTSILFWFIFIIISNALKNYAGANFIDMSDSHEAITLLVFVIFGFVAGTVISHYAEIELLNSRELAEKNRAIQNMANELELKVNERTNELSELNKKLRVSLEEREIFSLKLKELNAQLEATLNALPDKMFDLDIEGIVFDYRTTKPESLYASPADFLGKNISDFLPADVCAIIKKALFTAQRDGLCSGIIYKLNFAEETRWFELSIAKKELITDSGDRFVSLVRDVTDRKKTEEDLRLRSEELEAFNRIMIDREMRVIDLKEEVNALCKQLSIALPYPQDWKEKR
jgi:PAS domain-containing protein